MTTRRVLLILCLAWCASAGASCPSECSCKWKSGKLTVDCSDRGLITIPSGIENDTQVLDVSGNDLQVLERDAFQKPLLNALQKLYLRSCRLGQIDKYAFRGLQNLIEIDLSNNLLTHVPSQAFEYVPYLRNISLAHNPIQKVEAFAFQLLPQLTKLDLSQCEIQSVRAKAFDKLDILDSLKLNDNRLRELPTDTLQSLRKLHHVELQGNEWKCDCHLRSLKLWTSNSGNYLPHNVFCIGGPERLKDKLISELDVEDFACRPTIKTDARRLTVAVGSNVTIECRVESDPIATVSWYKGGNTLLSNDTITENGQSVFIIENEDSVYDKRSKLVLTQVNSYDDGEYHCVAENRAGNDEANFTLRVTTSSGPIVSLGGSSINVITIALAFLMAFMLVVIVLLVRRIRYGSGYDDDDDDDKKVKPPEKNSMDTSSQRSHDSEIKSDSGKAFTVTSDLSYSRSLSDIGNPMFSNPDLISGTNMRDSTCITPLPITRPISDYSQNWHKSYAAPRAASASSFNYDLQDRMPMVVDTVSAAGSGSDEVFLQGRLYNDYPPDYGLPILPENAVVDQPCAKTLKVWQRGVPVLPPMCSGPPLPPPPVPPPPFQGMPPQRVRTSPVDRRYHRCGTDV